MIYLHRNKKNEAQSAPDTEKPKPCAEEAKDESEKVGLKQNKGYGCNLEHYKWTQTKEDVEVRSHNNHYQFEFDAFSFGFKTTFESMRM